LFVSRTWHTRYTNLSLPLFSIQKVDSLLQPLPPYPDTAGSCRKTVKAHAWDNDFCLLETYLKRSQALPPAGYLLQASVVLTLGGTKIPAWRPSLYYEQKSVVSC
jgi:hypothetical protein